MSGPRFAILGSCVTGDIFRVAGYVGELVSYHARTSLVSLMSPSLDLVDDDLSWPSNFARRMIMADFTGTFFDDLEGTGCDYLIVDFVDERFPLMRSGDSWVTRSIELVDSGIDGLARHRFVLLPRFDLRTQGLWEDACSAFAAEFRARFPEVRVVLHRALGVDRYHDDGGVRSLAPICDGIGLGALNRMLEHYYDCFVAQMGALIPFDLPRRSYVAAGDHVWGLSPFHYEQRYYLDAADVLRALPVLDLARAG